jgi:hypothetical protein
LRIQQIFLKQPSFLEIELRTFQLLMPSYDTGAAHERDWLLVSQKTNKSVPIQERSFQWAASHRPVSSSWALTAMQIATVGTESNPFF